ncbi:hypothetical protein [Marinomonas balearica]|uniref:Uncharacterized protein n=1 Tax=Marinomonas balearica TaxID=491947 RepID=A0A4R6MBQ9_9GAMM|nr:hypothetical protein [Marinomonas balearica]TDO98746.1 hypothetical protein DFP79_1158 [Marinomonas balearica]
MLKRFKVRLSKRQCRGWVLLEMVLSLAMIAFLFQLSKTLIENSGTQVNETVLKQRQINLRNFSESYFHILGSEFVGRATQEVGHVSNVSLHSPFPECSRCTGPQFDLWAKRASTQ